MIHEPNYFFEHNMKEQEILQTVQRAFREATGGTIKLWKENNKKNIHPFDLMLELKLNGKTEAFMAEVKNEVKMPDLPALLIQFRKVIPGYNNPPILLAQYIPGPVKEELKKHQVNYLEAAGNCHISTEKYFIFTNNLKTAPVRKTTVGRLWNRTGLKYVYAWLTHPDFWELPLRQQADIAGVALGNVTQFKEELQRFIQKTARTNTKGAKAAVLEEWGLNFNKHMRHTLLTGKFRLLNNTDKTELELPENTWWGGETAGAFLTQYLRTESIMVYTRNKTQLMQKWKLLPDENGNVELYEPFWPEEQDNKNTKTVHPMLVWAELQFDMDQRLRETAERIMENNINTIAE